jgi:hypothetical protein
MVKCIFCSREISEDKIKDHLAEEHLGVHFTNGAPPALDPQQQAPQKPYVKTTEPTDTPKTQLTQKQQKPDPPPLPLEKPKKRYLNAQEIMNLLQNTNKQFPTKEVPGCPLTKENE